MRRFSGTVLKSGEHLVPEAALAALAERNFEFSVKGIASAEAQNQRIGRKKRHKQRKCGGLTARALLQHLDNSLHLIHIVEHPPCRAEAFLPPDADELGVAVHALAQFIEFGLLLGAEV